MSFIRILEKQNSLVSFVCTNFIIVILYKKYLVHKFSCDSINIPTDSGKKSITIAPAVEQFLSKADRHTNYIRVKLYIKYREILRFSFRAIFSSYIRYHQNLRYNFFSKILSSVELNRYALGVSLQLLKSYILKVKQCNTIINP